MNEVNHHTRCGVHSTKTRLVEGSVSGGSDCPVLHVAERTRSSCGEAARFRPRGLFPDLPVDTYASGGVMGRAAVVGVGSSAGKVVVARLGARDGRPFGEAPAVVGSGAREVIGCGRIGRRSLLALSAREGRPLFFGSSGAVCGRKSFEYPLSGLGRIDTCVAADEP